MNIALWVLQVLLALHTLMGAGWKFMNGPAAVPTLKAFPSGVWVALAVVEILCAAALVAPALVAPALNRSWAMLAPVAAILIAVEMLAFCVVHLASGNNLDGHVGYWLVVAVVCAFIAYGRLVVSPL